MTTKHRPSLLRRLLGWRTRPQQRDPADMGTEIGLEYFLAQSSGQPPATSAAPAHSPARPWQAWRQ